MSDFPENEKTELNEEEFSTIFSAPTAHKKTAEDIKKKKRLPIIIASFLAVAVLIGGTLGIKELIPEDWYPYLKEETEKEYFQELEKFVQKEYAEKTIYPAQENIFNSINYLCPEDIKVVIIGQDPYHEPNQAHGFSFSVEGNVPHPKSLINIFKELEDDIGIKYPKSGNLTPWAEQGVLMLNSVLTVQKGEANTHKDKGWENITLKIVETVLNQPQPKVFILWGNQAADVFFKAYKKQPNVMFIKSAHPSPLSAYRGFFGSKPFSKTNTYLRNHNQKEIDWTIN